MDPRSGRNLIGPAGEGGGGGSVGGHGSGYPKEDRDQGGGGGVEAQKSGRGWRRVTSAVEDSLLTPSLGRLAVQHG